MEGRNPAPTASRYTAADGPGRRRWLVLAVICCAYLMVGLDLTVMNLALPSAQRALGFSDSNRQWIVTAYALPFGSLLLFCGRLSDLVGRKRTFLVGLAGFACASAVGGAATSFGMLVAARACQGAFAALLSPACLSLLAVTFTDPKERGRAFGVFGGVIAAGGGLGLLVGGALTDGLGWRWCMDVNLVFAVAAIVGGSLLIGRQPTVAARMDVPGVLAASAGMFCVVYGFSRAGDGWGRPTTWGFLTLGAALLAGFTVWQTRAASPLLPPRIVVDRNRGGAYLTMLFVGAAYFGLLLFLVYYMQTILGYSAIASGCALLPTVLSAIVMTNVGGTTVMPRVGPRPLVATGLLVAAGATAWLTRIDVDSSYATALLGPFALLGLGMGLVFSAALNTGTSGVAPHDAGVASASFSTGQQVGSAIGTALLTTIASRAATSWLRAHAHGGPSPAQLRLAAVHSYATVFGWSAAILAAGALVVTPLLRPGPLPAPTPQLQPDHPDHPEPARV